MLRLCAVCDRHARSCDSCPFCGGSESAFVPAGPTKRMRRSALATFGAVALSLSACEAVSTTPIYGEPDLPIPPADAAADGPRRDATFAFPPVRDSEATDGANDSDADASTDASDTSTDTGTD